MTLLLAALAYAALIAGVCGGIVAVSVSAPDWEPAHAGRHRVGGVR